MNTSLLAEVTNQLALTSDTPSLDASVLIAQIVDRPRTWVVAHPELVLTAPQQKQLDNSLARLEDGEPFPYVLGHWEFFGLEFDISPDVLIPRPETELLIEKAIAWLQRSPVRRTIADVGTGSGAIAVSIAANIPDAHVLATDISLPALRVAHGNAVKHNVANRVDFLQCDLLPAHIDPLSTERHFDLICANLPYIPTETLHTLPIFGREPTLALDGGPDGLDPFRRLLDIGPEWLAPNGMMLLEVEATRGIQALNLACDVFSEATIHLYQDLLGRNRLLEISP
ncbi:MAG TPA: peptide chain release factor N(5)-glutamine methyltransferase [Anaerolineales bacterium]|nr:peptide chain release factor N(5)-glutamine methyltransferase [Anaerolineales bacterium]